MKTRNKKTAILLHIVLLILCFITLYPFAWMLFSSLKPTGDIMSVPPRFIAENPSLDNFRTVFSANIGRGFINSLFIATVRTGLSIYLSALLGYVFAKFKFKGKELIFTLMLASMMIPWIVTIIPLYNVINKLRLIDKRISLIITGICSGYGIFLMRSFMYQIDNAYMESARIDGCGEFTIFNKIVLPLLTPVLAALGIMTFLYSWDDFLWPFLILNSESKFTLTIMLSKFAFKHYTIDYGPVIAGSVISIMPVIIVFVILQKKIIEGITIGGIKG